MANPPAAIAAPTQEMLWAVVNVPKPAPAPTQTASPLQVTNQPTADPSTATEETSSFGMDHVNNHSSDYQEYDDRRWIDVNLSQQQIYLYESDVLVNSFIVSTGLYDTPTVTGEYRIYVKVPIQDMSGPGYYLSDVPWVMFFYEDYGFHGTYWHNSFGTPMSRGCVNLSEDDAAWLYNWAFVGTRVSIHY
jgi:lipoprotein-anchoring transpeptidase ErfK/SrfK